MLRARDAMDRTFAEPLCVARLAEIAGVSEAHFIRTFRATFGEPPHRYLQRRRVERAMFLLRATETSVTDICFEVGFGSLGTFSRTFAAIVGEVTDDIPPAGPPAHGADLLHDGLEPAEQFRRSTPRPPTLECLPHCGVEGVTNVLNSISISHVFVSDQDQGARFLRREARSRGEFATRTSASCAG